jgi:(S)-2-hydroxyglutarate dehydrogenase
VVSGLSPRYDHAVVGAGILGLACARELLARQPDRRIVVLDAAPDVASEQSGHNSGVIHAGVYYSPGSLKARLCVTGAAQMYEYCQLHGIEARRLGKLIIATERRELPALEEVERRARANGVTGIRRLAAGEIQEIEPQATGVAALHSPNTGIVDFGAVCGQLAQEVQDAGGELRLGWRVRGVLERGRGVRLTGPSGEEIECAAALFCAGLQADRLAVLAGAPHDPRIVPFRGAYLRLRPEQRALVRGLVYPVPDPALPFLGVHLTPRLDGEVLAGPTALMVGARDAYRVGRVSRQDLLDTLSWPGTWRMMFRWWRTGLGELHLAVSRRVFARHLARYVPALTAADLQPAFAGIRAQTVSRDGRLVDDFVLSSTARTVHVRNAPSPAATSAFALARLIVDRLEGQRGP